MKEDDVIQVCSSSRLTFLAPHSSNDLYIWKIYKDPQTMLPYLSSLLEISPEAFAQRRQDHRQEFGERTSLFLDIVHNDTRQVIGTTGFRVIDMGKKYGEWGVIIDHKHCRKGFAKEAMTTCLAYAYEHLGLTWVLAKTTPLNLPARRLFENTGWTLYKNLEADDCVKSEPNTTVVLNHNQQTYVEYRVILSKHFAS